MQAHGCARRALLVAVLFLLLSSCAALHLEDCGGEIVGVALEEPRIRSSRWRMILADLPAVGRKLSPYAAMSALAYADDGSCDDVSRQAAVAMSGEDRGRLNAITLESGWTEIKDLELLERDRCEDELGLFFRVWIGSEEGHPAVVIGFRGTENKNATDWLRGNLHWLTGHIDPVDDQYKRARRKLDRLIKLFKEKRDGAAQETRFYTTGHSLGGGLAQHMLYSFPGVVRQAFVFNPSPATGYVEQEAANQIAGCRCDNVPEGEARIYRVYDYQEVLANVRFFHKLFFKPERHVQEIRVTNKRTHSMLALADFLQAQAKRNRTGSDLWYGGRGSQEGKACTSIFREAQVLSCKVNPDPGAGFWARCPW